MEPSGSTPALTLDYVLGCDPSQVCALRPVEGSPGPRLAYAAGNVGVIYDAGTKKQTLLRGHVRASAEHGGAARRRRRRGAPARPARGSRRL